MNPAANNWASSDATQNITLADADQFENQLVAAVAVQFADRFVKTAVGEIISEAELRKSPLPAVPLNLWGTLAGVGGKPVNVAQMRTAVKAAAQGSNPVGSLLNVLQQALPNTDVSSVILRLPAVAIAVGTALAQIT